METIFLMAKKYASQSHRPFLMRPQGEVKATLPKVKIKLQARKNHANEIVYFLNETENFSGIWRRSPESTWR